MARKTYDGIVLEDLVKDYHSGDLQKQQKALATVIEAMESFIKRTIKTRYARFANRYFDDLVQCAYLAIVKNFKNYDPSKSNLSTYFAPYIDSEIYNFLSEIMWCGSRHFTQIAKTYEKATERLKETGKSSNVLEISEATGLPISTVHNIQTIIAINNPIELGDAWKFGVGTEDVLKTIESNEIYKNLYDCINSLPSIVRAIVVSTYKLSPYPSYMVECCHGFNIAKAEKDELLKYAYNRIKNSKVKDFY